MTASALILRIKARMDRATTLEGMHRLCILKFRLLTILQGV